ncbi:protein RRC1 isoform X1 [Cinnamomum micranthum f. kanehirae]|uniref:Protein RRC1 isoform X1 n=1 Tax=Cinnamomum micranthum f. kanehirae TaxID=337451 RepID=A0A3S3PZL1_9MAGN|nr:protein RRC1 isoform X1 [Cinnamomum micranthum f. kanehirae]
MDCLELRAKPECAAHLMDRPPDFGAGESTSDYLDTNVNGCHDQMVLVLQSIGLGSGIPCLYLSLSRLKACGFVAFDVKMSSFSITRKKTPFQKHREEEEAKKKRAEDETARLYAEFVESFQGDNAPGSKAFVRGGTINPNEKLKTDSEGGNSKDGASVPKKGSR